MSPWPSPSLAGVNAVGTASPSRSPSRSSVSRRRRRLAPAGGASVALALVVRRVETPAAPGGIFNDARRRELPRRTPSKKITEFSEERAELQRRRVSAHSSSSERLKRALSLFRALSFSLAPRQASPPSLSPSLSRATSLFERETLSQQPPPASWPRQRRPRGARRSAPTRPRPTRRTTTTTTRANAAAPRSPPRTSPSRPRWSLSGSPSALRARTTPTLWSQRWRSPGERTRGEREGEKERKRRREPGFDADDSSFFQKTDNSKTSYLNLDLFFPSLLKKKTFQISAIQPFTPTRRGPRLRPPRSGPRRQRRPRRGGEARPGCGGLLSGPGALPAFLPPTPLPPPRRVVGGPRRASSALLCDAATRALNAALGPLTSLSAPLAARRTAEAADAVLPALGPTSLDTHAAAVAVLQLPQNASRRSRPCPFSSFAPSPAADAAASRQQDEARRRAAAKRPAAAAAAAAAAAGPGSPVFDAGGAHSRRRRKRKRKRKRNEGREQRRRQQQQQQQEEEDVRSRKRPRAPAPTSRRRRSRSSRRRGGRLTRAQQQAEEQGQEARGRGRAVGPDDDDWRRIAPAPPPA